MKKVTPKNVGKVLDKLKEYVSADFLCEEGKKDFCEDLTLFLDELHSNDFFGTEGDSDPRGQ